MSGIADYLAGYPCVLPFLEELEELFLAGHFQHDLHLAFLLPGFGYFGVRAADPLVGAQRSVRALGGELAFAHLKVGTDNYCLLVHYEQLSAKKYNGLARRNINRIFEAYPWSGLEGCFAEDEEGQERSHDERS